MSNQDREPDMVGRWITNNLGAIITAGVLLTGGVAGYTRLENQVENINAYRQERTRTVDAALVEIRTATATLPNLAYRVTANEESLKATNARVDQSLSNISARLAEINQQLGALSTQVAVLTQQVTPQRRADAKPPG